MQFIQKIKIIIFTFTQLELVHLRNLLYCRSQIQKNVVFSKTKF
jgi:hypothetical protein